MDIDQISSITWIEILPKDCIDCIRYWVSKQDFSSVLQQLEIATNSERKWISDCERIYFKNMNANHTYDVLNTGDPYMQAIPSISRVKDYIINNFYTGYNQLVPPITFNNLLLEFDKCGDNYYSKSTILEKLWDFIEHEIGIIHNIIAGIKNEYKKNIAIPVEFAGRLGSTSDRFAWIDTKASFSRYIMENIPVASYQLIIYNLLRIIFYNCGHLRTVRYNVEKCKIELYKIYY